MIMAVADAGTQQSRKSEINRHKLWLVERGNEIGKLAKANRDWASQARGLWEAARHETEPIVLLNLLAYQKARNDNWIEPADVFTPLQAAMRSCIEEKAKDDRELALDLIRHLLVYTIRSHVYHRKES
jgi:hypothetical protein